MFEFTIKEVRNVYESEVNVRSGRDTTRKKETYTERKHVFFLDSYNLSHKEQTKYGKGLI